MDIVKRIASMMRPYRKTMVMVFALQLIVILTRLIVPIITQTIVNDVITAGNVAILLPLCAELLGLVVLRSVCTYIRSVSNERVSQNLAYDIRTGLYRHLEELPYEFYDKHRIGEIMSRMTGDLEGVRNMIAGGLITAFDNALMFLGALIFMGAMSFEMLLLLILFLPVIGATAFAFNKRIRPVFASIREQNAVLNTRTQENLAGMRVVKAFAREDYEEERFYEDNQTLLKLNLRATYVWSRFVPLMELLSGLCTPVALIGGALLTASGRMDVGTLVGVTGYIWMLTNPVRALSNIINMTAQAITSAEKLLYYMDFGSRIREKPDAVSPAKFEGAVEFDNVTFSYGGEPVLRNINLKVEPGQTIAVMGATGAGKSTLCLLLGRFYDVMKGRVLVDGIDVRDQKLDVLRREIGYVPQETFLFSDTLEDNIRFGRVDAPHDRVEQAADVACATEFIDHMPSGYETIVGERGLGLSGGQKQRTAIARAVLIDPKILVLDDSTSAVDMETEAVIQQKLRGVLKGRTTFIIAHRISSVMNADQIIVLDHGEIAERGTHRELMELGGIYANMVAEQTANMVDEEVG
ncbi:MAG TPA: ABC transporter ATP-binding protein [Candidatus Alectryocaccomicrobium excrementavium]|uniref:ABC transporter ATP-binding protein n=1 Tax=Candidatus Alectryocaccomicrobium excrementavium TaxID=2840668 RepID=A0A9D1K5S3_9FIRM|nr:ABC transporter ATP-binding protein [Candidatus Alectryocaccomicrobium excrementavium]